MAGYDPHHQDKKKRHPHAQANFSEAWVEFMDKAVAKTVARMLNAQVIGGKKGDRWVMLLRALAVCHHEDFRTDRGTYCRWRDDIWTMKYLSGFKWEMLGEQVGKAYYAGLFICMVLRPPLVYEKQAHQARLRNEITRSRSEQSDYLRNVELARVLNKRRSKKASAGSTMPDVDGNHGQIESGSMSTKPTRYNGEAGKSDARREYQQRKTVDGDMGSGGRNGWGIEQFCSDEQ